MFPESANRANSFVALLCPQRPGHGAGGRGRWQAPQEAPAHTMDGRMQRVEVEEQDILVLADLIGIGRDEPEYLWIAKEAYNADLPVGWQIFFDDEGKHFYFDPKTESSTTQHPCIGYYQDLYKDFKKQDAEFRKQQEAQELAMGMAEAGRQLQAQKKVIAGDDGEGTSEGQRRDEEAAELTGQDPDDAAGEELLAKAKLLQAYSHDPNLASHYRRDMLEQDKRASDMMKSILQREEDMFVQRLRLYVSKKEESARAPLENVLAEYAETSQSHVDEALQAIVSQMNDLKTQMVEVKEAAANKSEPPKKKDADRDARLAKLSKMGTTSALMGIESPVGGLGSPTGEHGRPFHEDECSQCKQHQETIKSLEAKVKDLEENGVVVKDKGAGEGRMDQDQQRMERERQEFETKRELDDLRMKLAAANMKNKQQQDELQKLKTFVASSMVQEIDADESRGRMDQLSKEARRHDALGWEDESRPGTSAGVSRPGTSGSVAFSDPNRPGTAGTAGSASTTATGFAERFTASGMTADVMMQVLEKVEALSAEGKGPIHQIRTDKENLLAQVAQLETEVGRWKTHSEHVEEQNKQHVRSLAKMEGQKSEIVRAKEHSEHMEFLAQQYADQVQNLQGMLRRLRDQVTQSQLTVDANKEAAKRHALAHGVSNSANTPAEKGKNAFSVRVRSSTILDVKRCTSTLRSAINLLRIDFQVHPHALIRLVPACTYSMVFLTSRDNFVFVQSYAEGIFLPLARELQQSTLYLATSLSAKARELRFCTNSLSLAFASQRLLEHKLHSVYKVSFHSLVYLRGLEDGEQNNFRTPLPRTLTMQLKNGFENKRDMLEIYEFEKVLAPENDVVTIFQELMPFFARICNWDSACLIITGGRFSKKEDLVNGTSAIDENRKTIKLPSVFEQAIEYVSHIYKDEKEKLYKARLTEYFDLQFFLEYSEVN